MKACKKLVFPLTAVMVAVVALLQVMGESYSAINSWNRLFKNPIQSTVQFLIVFLLWYALLAAAYRWCERPFTAETPVPYKKVFAFSLLVLGICWLPGIVINYPGSFGTDALYQLKGYYGYEVFIDDNLLHTLMMAVFVNLGDFLGNRGLGAFLYTVFQALLLAVCFAVVCAEIYTMLRGKGRKPGYALSLLFFAVVPMWGQFAQWISKDVPYTAITTLWLVCLMRCIRSGKTVSRANLVCLTVTAILTCLLRLNGPFAVFPTMVVLLLAMPRGTKKYLAVSLMSVLVIYTGAHKVLSVPAGRITENQPLKLAGMVHLNQVQQVMRSYIEHPGGITPEEYAIIDEVIEADKMAETYSPTNLDPILGIRRATTPEEIRAFQQLWFRILLRYPASCVQASLNKCFGYYSASARGYVKLLGHEIEPDPRLELTPAFSEAARGRYQELISKVENLPGLRYLATAGFYTQVAFLCGWSLLRKKKWKELIPLLPIGVNICVCLASPLSRFIRYELPVAAAAPLLMAWVVAVLKAPPQDETL